MADFYRIYRGQDGNFDYGNPVAEMALEDTQVFIPNQDLPPDTIWYYIRRRVADCCGKESPDGPVCIVRIDSNGNMIGSIPNAPVDLVAKGLSNGRVKLRWRYVRIDEEIAPTGFHIYIDSGSGFDFDNPDATIPYHHGGARSGEFDWTSDPLTHGEIYRFCVRVYRQPAEGVLNITGELTPDATCNYYVAGKYSEKDYYRRGDGAWFIWWHYDKWWITTVLGGMPPFGKWFRYDSNIVGDYTPVGSETTGIATVAEGSHLIHESQNTDYVSIVADSVGPDAITDLITSVEEV